MGSSRLSFMSSPAMCSCQNLQCQYRIPSYSVGLVSNMLLVPLLHFQCFLLCQPLFWFTDITTGLGYQWLLFTESLHAFWNYENSPSGRRLPAQIHTKSCKMCQQFVVSSVVGFSLFSWKVPSKKLYYLVLSWTLLKIQKEVRRLFST